MRTKRVSRKAAFDAALAAAGKTQKQWRAERVPPVSQPHLYLVLTGERQSASLLADVDRFIAEHGARRTAAA